MIEHITFLHSNWIWQICIGAMLLWGIFIWKEWHQQRRRSFWVKIAMAFLGIASLVLIALKPALPILSKKTKVAILTSGYKKEQVDSLKKVHKRLKAFQYKANQSIFGKTNTSDSVFVLGQGLEPFDFWQLENTKVHYLQGMTPSGIIRCKYNNKKTVGEQLQVEGLYTNPKKGNRLVLEGPAGKGLDSINLESDKKQFFQLSTELKVTGTYNFSLTEKDTLGKILSRDPIPIIVRNRKNLKILIVNSFPTFETKYLKNYLSEMGHQVLVKSQITRGRYKFEYFNMNREALGAFSKKNLEPFDLVIVDANTVKSLGKSSRVALENSVRENGLGLFIQPDTNFFHSTKGVANFSFVQEKSIETSLDNSPQIKIVKYPFRFKDQFQLQVVHRNAKEHILSAYKYLGKGRIGATVLESTYQMLLNGNTKDYQKFWSKLIGEISKKEVGNVSWSENQIIAVKDQPYEFTLKTSVHEPEVKTKEGYRIAMRRDIDMANLWKGKTYPKKLGWSVISVQQDTTAVLAYFVTDTTKWKSMSAYSKIQKNSKYFNRHSNKETERISPLQPINPIGLYVFFILCMGFLWLAPKIGKE